MTDRERNAIAIVGMSAILPDAPNMATFWDNISSGRYSISDIDPERWDPALYFDPDHSVPDRSYSKIGGFVRQYAWEPFKWRLPIPPKVADAMDQAQKWAVACTHMALEDYGYPKRELGLERTAVILGNAMAGEKHYESALRISFPEYARWLKRSESFQNLPAQQRELILAEMHQAVDKSILPITEDTMPGELANVMAGRIANVFNFRGPNFVCDAACASAMAAISAAAEGLIQGDFDAVVTGGVDRNMGASTYVKFCKIGALSATGTRPYADGADGFVMGEGASLFILKRLADAERAGDKIYAVLRGIGGSSDGKGKGITAPNPVGQILAVKRAWKNSGLSPAGVTMVEGHGTSTRVGDVVEVESLNEVFGAFDRAKGSIALGSVKSNIGHLKGAAGAAGLLKAALCLHHKQLVPSLNFERANPNINFDAMPFQVNNVLREWRAPNSGVRSAGVSAFGFGGTNFHMVLEEHVHGRLTSRRPTVSVPGSISGPGGGAALKAPLRGAMVIGASTVAELQSRLQKVNSDASAGRAPKPEAPLESDLRANERVVIDYADAQDLAEKSARALKVLASDNANMWKALRAKGIYRGSGPAAKVAFLYTGQGSQYVGMLQELRKSEPIVAEMFKEADEISVPLLGRPLSEYIFVPQDDPEAVKQAEVDLRQTQITQPAVLATDIAMTRMLDAYGIAPDMVMGHSLGEYGALVAAGALPFADALEAVSARGREMVNVSVADNGKMAAVFANPAVVQEVLDSVDGYVVIANINSNKQAVIGGASEAVEAAVKACQAAGHMAMLIPVSHAFHTTIVAPASGPLRSTLERLALKSPKLPIVANTSGDFYPMGPDVKEQMLDILAAQVASPVQFVKGLHRLYEAGARVFIEVGPKRALHGFADNVLGHHPDVLALHTNHPKQGDLASFNIGLCGLYAAGLGTGRQPEIQRSAEVSLPATRPVARQTELSRPVAASARPVASAPAALAGDRYSQLGHLFAEFLERGMSIYNGAQPAPARYETPVVITGAALGLPGGDLVFSRNNVSRILHGEQMIKPFPARFRDEIVDKNIVRLVKSESGTASWLKIESGQDSIKLAGRGGRLELDEEYGLPKERLGALDTSTRLSIASGLEAMRDAGIPIVQRYKTTTKGTKLPDRWGLPEMLQDETGVIFASAFPGYDSFAAHLRRYHEDRSRRETLSALQELRGKLSDANPAAAELDSRISALQAEIERDSFQMDRKFLFQILSMGHSQFAELIGARGPNTQVNAACASTTQAMSLAEDWIRAGRCRRVIVVAGDDVTSDNLLEWIGAGFLITGAAATDERVEDAALPFDRRRHGMILGMGGAAIVVESADAAAERGIAPICEVLSTVTANSAFHGTRLDVSHISQLMEQTVSQAEERWGIDRHQIAPNTVFVSHETYTPARGGSAAAEVFSLRETFGASADSIVVANTKGYTGHAMGAGIEDVLAVKALETGLVPAVANYKELDPELGGLNLSRGGSYPVDYALRLGAGFGSQVSMSLIHRSASPGAPRPHVDELGYDYRIVDRARWQGWLNRISGYSHAELELHKKTLRIRDQGAAALAGASPVVTPPAAAPRVAPANVVAPAVEPRPVAAQAAAPAHDPVKEKILALVTELTGYPSDMLALDLDLEADLGVDTVKQAEMFAAVREQYGIAREDNLRLRDFPTLQHVIQFVRDRRPDLAPVAEVASPARPTAPAAAASVTVAVDPVQEKILALVTELTGYPPEMLDLELDLEADLGVDTVKQAEMFASVREEYGIEREDNLQLRDFPTLAHVVQFVRDRRPDLAQAVVVPVAVAPAAAAPMAEPVAQATTALDPVSQKILALVTELTGYPPEMLDLDLDLEADLGVDTVKQAEMFASVREEYGIEREDNLQLRDFPTLAHVIQFVLDRRPDLKVAAPVAAPAPVVAAAAPAVSAAQGEVNPVQQKILDLVTELTGYPPEMLDLDLDLEADLGVDTVKQAEMFASVREEYGIAREDNLQLRDFPTLAHVIQFVLDRRPDLNAPVSVAGQSASAEVADDPVKQVVLALVTELTGYPAEMLDLDLDLEADLGVDTVKQAEMFAAVREKYGIERDDNLKLRDFPTLADVIQFVHDRRTTTEGTDSDAASPAAETSASRQTLVGVMEEAQKVPRRIPTPMLRPPLDLCKSTGVQLAEGSRVVLMSDKGGVAEQLAEQLKGLGVEPLVVNGAPTAAELTQMLDGWLESGSINGVYWLPGLDDAGDPLEMDLADWRESLRQRVKLLYATMRHLYDGFQGSDSFLVSATRLGGVHGYGEHGASAPMGGAVVGFSKAFKRERTEALVKAVDFHSSADAESIAGLLLAETQQDPGVVEVGYLDGQRYSIGLEQIVLNVEQPPFALNSDSVFVVTGAAGSIVSAITADLAAASGGTFYLLDLTPKPDAADPDLQLFATDREALKRQIFQRLKESGDRATPAMVERQLSTLERQQAALDAIHAVEAAGGTAIYHSCDLRDASAVEEAIAELRENHGRVDVLLHAAGIEISRFLPDKSEREFDLVLDVKCDGWFNLLKSIGEMPLGSTVGFSSIAGRFGNGGQTDYSAANDLLCKMSTWISAKRETRGIAIDWTAWGEIGMASRGSIPKMMEFAGIDMLSPLAGIPIVRREIESGFSGEVVIAERLGILMQEFDETGGLDTARFDESPNGPMVGRVTGMGIYSGLTVETELSPENQAFLDDHRIDGTPVLPGVMGVEGFAELATLLWPDHHVTSIEAVEFLAPFKFYRNEPRIVTLQARFVCEGDELIADCRLIGKRMLPNREEAQITEHFKARVHLASAAPEQPTIEQPTFSEEIAVESGDVYSVYFHGPAYQVTGSAWRSGEQAVGRWMEGLPANHSPEGLATRVAPRLIELCFQTAGLWEMGNSGRMALPMQIDRVVPWQGDEPDDDTKLFAVVTPDNGCFNADVIDESGKLYLRLEGYRTVALPGALDTEQVKPIRDAMS